MIPTDASVLACLLEADGAAVARDTLAQRLGLSLTEDPNLLHATIYRLRDGPARHAVSAAGRRA